jgi:hypothetical protein
MKTKEQVAAEHESHANDLDNELSRDHWDEYWLGPNGCPVAMFVAGADWREKNPNWTLAKDWFVGFEGRIHLIRRPDPDGGFTYHLSRSGKSIADTDSFLIIYGPDVQDDIAKD